MDEAGRVRMFRGINAVNKKSPYYFDVMLNATIVKELAGLGMNIVRLGNMWNGWQPIGPDNFDELYGEMVEVIVLHISDFRIRQRNIFFLILTMFDNYNLIIL